VILENAILRPAHKKTLLMRLFLKTYPRGKSSRKAAQERLCSISGAACNGVSIQNNAGFCQEGQPSVLT
jgi:hypothetical protein